MYLMNRYCVFGRYNGKAFNNTRLRGVEYYIMTVVEFSLEEMCRR
jgi:hypothetical protein